MTQDPDRETKSKPDWLKDEPDDSESTESSTVAGGPESTAGQTIAEPTRTAVMVLLTGFFVVFWLLAVLGCLPKTGIDAPRLMRIEPIIFAIIGYYFGREPSLKNEQLLRNSAREERTRRSRAEGRATTEKLRAERAETKIRNARAAMSTSAPRLPLARVSTAVAVDDDDVEPRNLRQATAAALRILES